MPIQTLQIHSHRWSGLRNTHLPLRSAFGSRARDELTPLLAMQLNYARKHGRLTDDAEGGEQTQVGGVRVVRARSAARARPYNDYNYTLLQQHESSIVYS